MLKELRIYIAAIWATGLLILVPSNCQAGVLPHTVNDLDKINNFFQPIFTDAEPIGSQGADAYYQLFRIPTGSKRSQHVLYAHNKNHRYRLLVEVNGRKFFECEFRHGISLEREDAVKIEDLNQDGFKDIRVLGGFVKGEPWYKVWFFDPALKKYRWGGT